MKFTDELKLRVYNYPKFEGHGDMGGDFLCYAYNRIPKRLKSLQYRGKRPFEVWLKVVLHRMFLDFLKESRNRIADIQQLPDFDTAEDKHKPNPHSFNTKIENDKTDVLSDLTSNQQWVTRLCAFDAYDFGDDDITELSQISGHDETTIKSLISDVAEYYREFQAKSVAAEVEMAKAFWWYQHHLGLDNDHAATKRLRQLRRLQKEYRRMEPRSLKNISKVLGLTPSAVKMIRYKAKKKATSYAQAIEPVSTSGVPPF